MALGSAKNADLWRYKAQKNADLWRWKVQKMPIYGVRIKLFTIFAVSKI